MFTRKRKQRQTAAATVAAAGGGKRNPSPAPVVQKPTKRNKPIVGKTKVTKKAVVEVATTTIVIPVNPPKPVTELSSQTESTSTTTKSTKKKRKRLAPVRLVPHANMPIARFNLSMDLWREYNFTEVFDQGVEREKWTSYRLKTNVLLLETVCERYELVRVCHALVRPSNLPLSSLLVDNVRDTFELYRILNAPKMNDEVIATLPRPLLNCLKELVLGGLDWNEISWGESCVRVRDMELHMTCLCFVPRTSQGDAEQARQIINLRCPPPTLAASANVRQVVSSTHTILTNDAASSSSPSLSKQQGGGRVKRRVSTQLSGLNVVPSVNNERPTKRRKSTRRVRAASRTAADVSRASVVTR